MTRAEAGVRPGSRHASEARGVRRRNVAAKQPQRGAAVLPFNRVSNPPLTQTPNIRYSSLTDVSSAARTQGATAMTRSVRQPVVAFAPNGTGGMPLGLFSSVLTCRTSDDESESPRAARTLECVNGTSRTCRSGLQRGPCLPWQPRGGSRSRRSSEWSFLRHAPLHLGAGHGDVPPEQEAGGSEPLSGICRQMGVASGTSGRGGPDVVRRMIVDRSLTRLT